MRSWPGFLYLSRHADPLEVTVLATEKNITIGYRQEDGSVALKKWNTWEVEISFDNSMQASSVVIHSEPGTRLLIPGKEPIGFIQDIKDEYQKPWHKKQGAKDRFRVAGIFTITIAVLVAGYFLLVPWLSEKLARTVEPATEARFGNAVYDAMAIGSQEQKDASGLVNEFFGEMKVATDYNIRITVVKGDMVNAFALPGGHIVIYSGLLNRLQTYPELASLLGHEFIHINNRHSTRAIFRQMGSRVFLSLLFGNFGSVTSVLIDNAERFKSLKYSRSLEREADLEGLELLKKRKIHPQGFAVMLQRLKDSATRSVLPEFLESHPDINSRIRYIREATGQVEVEVNPQLEHIFEKIKQIK
jgi:Zn-dependent protease with chaperone function